MNLTVQQTWMLERGLFSSLQRPDSATHRINNGIVFACEDIYPMNSQDNEMLHQIAKALKLDSYLIKTFNRNTPEDLKNCAHIIFLSEPPFTETKKQDEIYYWKNLDYIHIPHPTLMKQQPQLKVKAWQLLQSYSNMFSL